MVSIDKLPLVPLSVGETEVAFIDGDDECTVQEELGQHAAGP